jgi:hypothetical protein
VTQFPSQPEQDTYRLVLVSPETQRCLTEAANGTTRLPRVAIPKWTRPAEEISRAIEQTWGLKVVVLDFFGDESEDSGCVTAELLKSNGGSFVNSVGVWRSIAELAEGELRGSELTLAEDLIALGATGRGAFSRFGWLDDAVAWISVEASDGGFQFTGELQQFNANATFCLVRLGNSRGPAYWLKAVGEPNLNEFPVTVGLAKHFPQYLPKLVATRPEWNAWVMEEAGSRVSAPLVLSELERVVTNLAELQKSSIEHRQTLLSFGCFDQQAPILRAHIPQLIDYMIDSMTKQTSTKAPRIEESRLREIGIILLDICLEMETLGIPETLIHNDFTLGNILIDEQRCVFTDWAEACIGNPIATYQHLRACVSHDERGVRWLPGLDGLYKRAWCDVLSESQLEKALILAPLLALCSHLFGRGAWLGSNFGEDPHFQRYARGLARHMDMAANAPELLEALCS